MASLGTAVAASAYAWNPVLAFGAMAVASYLDQQFLYPAILGKGKEQAKGPGLVGLPTTTTNPGSPRVWAMGRRIRVPLHVMYQSEKTREETVTGPKGGVAGQIKRVFADVGLSVNDRETMQLTQIIANGQLIYWTDKNLVRVTTSEMTGTFTTTTVLTGTVAAGSTTTQVNSVVGGMVVDTYARNYRWLQITSGPLTGTAIPIIANTATQFTVDWAYASAPGAGVTYSVIEKRLVLAMNSSYEPDFADFFVVGDIVDLRAFSSTPSGSSLGGRGAYSTKSWWRVNSVAGHGATPSSLTLEAMIGQDIGPLTSITAGTSFSPASVVREDTVWLDNGHVDWTQLFLVPSAPAGAVAPDTTERLAASWRRFIGPTNTYVPASGSGWQYKNTATGPTWTTLSAADYVSCYFRASGSLVTTHIDFVPPLSGPLLPGLSAWRSRSPNNTGVWQRVSSVSYEGRMFASDPGNTYYAGTEEQDEDDIILRTKTSGQVPGFRGLAYQMLDQWDLSTYFGNQVPPIIEAIIEPDGLLSVPDAILAACERAQSVDIQFDTSAIDAVPFEGYWTQGAIPTVTALQPIMTAFQIAAQERNDTLAFFNIENADVVQIENGAAFSDLGVQSGPDTPSAGDKLRITQRDVADLPTSVGVTHQDPDQQYAQGYQHFKQRQPSPLPSVNEQNIQLDNVVLSRKQARNLAGTLMRRAWVNATALEFQLPVAYCELLENDLVTLTDDEGQDYTARIIRREIGNNYVVNCYAVVEDVTLAVRGSPVQGPSDIIIGTPSPVIPTVRVIDIPPLADQDAYQPGYYIGACSPGLGAWGGASVFESRDAGNTWQQVAVLNTRCGIGTMVSSLSSGTIGDNIGSVAWDTANSFIVSIDDFGPMGEPFSMTEGDVLDGWNWMLIEDGANFEILGARDVVDNGDGTYTFDHLVRGLRGTYDSAATTKAAGSKVTFLFQARQQGALTFVPLNVSAANLPMSLQLKFVPPGMSLIDVTAETVTAEGWNARPMPGRMFTTELNVTTFDRTFTFEPWTRMQSVIGSGGPYNLDETFEGYSVRIYDPTGVTLMRTKTISSGPTGANRLRGAAEVLYSAAEQTADGYTPSLVETFKCERVQLGDFGEGRSWMEDV